MGITISIENFGTGYSNLSNLKNYDIDALKIGKSFVSNIDDDYDNAIVRAIINIAKSLDIKVIAEGISSKEAVETLTDMNSDIGQGCYWSQPLDEDTFIEYLQAEKMTQLQS
jgi:sensor c-di-GMP phosphodiesterase-like protein